MPGGQGEVLRPPTVDAVDEDEAPRTEKATITGLAIFPARF